jgi:hypothetical protein
VRREQQAVTEDRAGERLDVVGKGMVASLEVAAPSATA